MKKTGAHWNYRLVELPDGDDTILMLCEVYYDLNNKPLMRNDGARVSGETIEELKEVIGRMTRALDTPILKEADFPAGRRAPFES